MSDDNKKKTPAVIIKQAWKEHDASKKDAEKLKEIKKQQEEKKKSKQSLERRIK